ncbi:EamA family transporter [uncultured Roseovarius sp.]|uniref:EamA family transporter n=1 Tax=uncultured Roseovarius sp. TaxID=293344 RepID=UPI00262EF60A|nr:EamA family transporter [uncultured Roseovarius sp.]
MARTSFYQRQPIFGTRLGLKAPSVPTLGALAAWVAVILYAASNSIITVLVDIGQMNPVAGGRNAITYTNLYLLGSLISLIPLALLYRRDLTRDNLSRLTRRHWGLLVVSAILSSVLTPGLFFYALERTTVSNIVLVGRIEPPLFLLATWFFLCEKLNPWAMLAGLIALAGAIVILGAGSGMFNFGKGELATVAATLSFIASTIVTRAGLRDVPIGVFAVFRTVIGASLYFMLVSAVFGVDTFQDVFEPVVWQWVWLYAVVVIVLGQIAWNFGLKHARAGDVALATSFSPLAAILIAMVLLGEDPGPGLIPGGVMILIAIIIGNLRLPVRATPAPQPSALVNAVTELFAAPRSLIRQGAYAHVEQQPPRIMPRTSGAPTFLSNRCGTNPSSQSYPDVPTRRGLADSTTKREKMENDMKKLLATAAVGIALSAPAFADSHGHSPFVKPDVSAELRASELIGMRLYTSEKELENFESNEAGQDWEDVGEISDVILSRDGNVMAVMLDIGGFLGIGERTVAVNMSDLNLVSDGDDKGDFFIVVNSTKAHLEEAPEYDTTNVGNWSEARGPEAGKAIKNAKMAANEAGTETEQAMNVAAAETEQAAAEVEQESEQATGEVTAEMDTDATMDGYAMVDAKKMTAEELDGVAVYDTTQEWIGEVSKIVLSDSGEIQTVVVDVGGFLGIGEKPVGLDFEKIKVLRGEDGGDLRVHVKSSKEELESMQEYEG